MTTSTWIGIGLVALIVIGGFWYYASSTPVPVSVNQAQQAQNVTADHTQYPEGVAPDPNTTVGVSGSVDVAVGASKSATVTYNGTSYSPSTVTIAKGGTVTFTSTGGSNMWVASAQHPAHTTYDGTARAEHCAAGYTGAAPFDQCAPGASFTFTFSELGSWKYHDHINASAFGTVIVK